MAPRALSRGALALVLGALAVLPDVDVVAFRLGIPYEHPLGHRGFTHSLLFAVAAGAVGAWVVLGRRVRSRDGLGAVAILTLAAASHSFLDAFTDAGLGVGLFIPLSDARIFFPWRPLSTSPIGVDAFFSGPALAILWNEMLWVWLPVLCLALAVRLRRLRGRDA